MDRAGEGGGDGFESPGHAGLMRRLFKARICFLRPFQAAHILLARKPLKVYIHNYILDKAIFK